MMKWIGLPSAALIAGFGSLAVLGQAEAQDDAPYSALAKADISAAPQFAAPESTAAASAQSAGSSADSGIAIYYNGPDGAQSSAAALASTKPIPAVSEDAPKKGGETFNSLQTINFTAEKPRLQRAVASPADLKRNMVFTAGKDSFVIKRILPIQGPIKYGEWHWDDKGVPDGPIVMTVDLDARVLSVFKGGYEIGAAAVLLGTPQHPTPTGTFPILTKERHNVSEKYDNAPMPWTLRLTWDGIAIHGGGAVENGYASHGCVGAPDGFAAKLFAIAKKGDKVIITRGKSIGMGDKII